MRNGPLPASALSDQGFFCLKIKKILQYSVILSVGNEGPVQTAQMCLSVRKRFLWHERPAKTQIRLRSAQSDLSLLWAICGSLGDLRIAKLSMLLLVDSEYSDQTCECADRAKSSLSACHKVHFFMSRLRRIQQWQWPPGRDLNTTPYFFAAQIPPVMLYYYK